MFKSHDSSARDSGVRPISDSLPRAAARVASVAVLLCGLALLSGCQMLAVNPSNLPAPRLTHEFVFDPRRDDVVGELQMIRANAADTFPDIARRFNVGYEELASANPDIDPWLPGEGTEIIVPTQFVLPAAPRTGIVINLPAMRLFYFPPAPPGAPRRVITHPVGIGRVDWKTPEGATRIVEKTAAPTWYPTRAIRKEHAANGDPLPAVVPPGPDNPMGTHALRLGWPKYAIHGTNKPPSIGLRGTHGCVRLYPEDIARLYRDVPVGTPVRVVNQPTLFGWRAGELYVQSYPLLEEDDRDQKAVAGRALEAALGTRGGSGAGERADIEQPLLAKALNKRLAIAVPVSAAARDLTAYVAAIPRVRNPASSSAPPSDQSLSLSEVVNSGAEIVQP